MSGEVEMLTADQVKQAVLRALDDRPAVLVIDLLGVDFLGSVGLAVLIEAHQLAAEHTRLRVVASGTVTLRPLHVTGLDLPPRDLTPRATTHSTPTELEEAYAIAREFAEGYRHYG